MMELIKGLVLFMLLEIFLIAALKTLFIKTPICNIVIASVYIILAITVSVNLFK